MLKPIPCILTANRAGTLETLRWWPDAKLFVEPREVDIYRRKHPNNEVTSIGVDHPPGYGAFSRNFILAWARRMKSPVLMLDDDIQIVYRRRDDDGTSTFEHAQDGEAALHALAGDVTDEGCAVSVLGHRNWAHARASIRNYGLVRQAIAINPHRLPDDLTFDEGLIALHDLDFTVQLLTKHISYRLRSDHVVTAKFSGYSDVTERELAILVKRYGEHLFSIRRSTEGVLKSVGIRYQRCMGSVGESAIQQADLAL